MNERLEQIADFALGVTVPTYLVANSFRLQSAERENHQLKGFAPPSNYFVANAVMAGLDAVTYIAQVSAAFTMYNESNSNYLQQAALIGSVLVRGLLSRKIGREIRNLKEENIEMNSRISESRTASRMLPGR